ncbi:MAG: hypothetical protein WCT53_01230 [Candidatus Gracilibacteria bacterium]
MMEAHKPTRKQGIMFFLFTLLLVIFIFLWVFFINQGWLVVSGPAPFDINVGGSEKTCTASPCSIKLVPRKHTVSLSKEGYFEKTVPVDISMRKETKLEASFKFIPKVLEKGEMVLPFESAPLKPPYIGIPKLPNVPKSDDMLFSPSGKLILVSIGREFFIYNFATGETTNSDLLDVKAAWAGEDVVYLQTVDTKQALNLIKDGKGVKVVEFDRPFKSPEIIGDSAGNNILIVENSGGDSSFYLIDLGNKTRKKLEIPKNAKNVKFAAGHLIYDDGAVENKKVSALNLKSLETVILPAIDAAGVAELGENSVIFVSKEKRQQGQPVLGVTISEAIAEAQKETVDPQPKKDISNYVVEYDFSTKEINTLADITLKEGETVKKLTPYLEKDRIFFEKGGKAFEILLKEGA